MKIVILAGLLLVAALACGGRSDNGPPSSAPAGVSTTTVAPAQTATAAPSPPNIVLILADDLDADGLTYMPKLKTLLADQGTSFPNYFVNVSLCCPSRATTLRGQYAHNTKVIVNTGPSGGFERFHAEGEESSTVSTWLQAAGYRTMLAGKYLNGYPGKENQTYVPPGWTEWHVATSNAGYNEFNYTLNQNGKLVQYGRKPEEYGTDVYSRLAVDFVKRSAADRKPFFLYLAPFAPHLPATPAPRHANLFPDAKVPRTANYNEADVSDKPAHVRGERPMTQAETARYDADYRKRLQSLQAVDEAIEALIAALSASGQLSRTYIFFASDNGFHMGSHRLAEGKQTPYEEDIRVPMIVRGPGVAAARTLDHMVGNVDLAPTFAELAGARSPEFVDGRSLVPLLTGSVPAPASWRQSFLLQRVDPADVGQTDEPEDAAANTTGRAGSKLPAFWGVRTADYVYVEYVAGERELYDLKRDPFELDNLAAKAEANLLRQLAAILVQLRGCAGAACRTADAQTIR